MNDLTLLSELELLLSWVKIGVTKAGKNVEGTHIGNMHAIHEHKGQCNMFIIGNVIYVPKLRQNLLSVGRIESELVYKSCLLMDLLTYY